MFTNVNSNYYYKSALVINHHFVAGMTLEQKKLPYSNSEQLL